MSDVIKFIERKECPNHIGIQVNGLAIAKLRPSSAGWMLDTLDVVPLFWTGDRLNSFQTLEEAKEGAVKYFENWLNKKS